MTGCKHVPAIRIAANALRGGGRISTYDAVYRWSCPLCGAPQRTTRLADTVYALRHAYGWDIATHTEAGNLATYTLVNMGDMPGDEATGPHPRRLVRDTNVNEYMATPGLGGEPDAITHATGYSAYDGKPVPVEAIPTPRRVECSDCGYTNTTDKVGGKAMLGGWRQAICPSCSKPNRPVARMFRPV